MIRDDLFSFAFIKKSAFYGSCRGWRYRIGKKDDFLEVCTWPEPYSFDFTPEEQKVYKTFAFSPEGYEEAKEYLEALENSDRPF